MNAADYIVLVIALAGLLDVWIDRMTGKSMVERLFPDANRRSAKF